MDIVDRGGCIVLPIVFLIFIVFHYCFGFTEKESDYTYPQYKVELLNTRGEVVETKFAHNIYEVGFYKGQYRFEYYYFVKYKIGGGGYFKCEYYTINKKDVQITKGTFKLKPTLRT